MSANGELTDSELAPIAGGGYLANEAAAGWNALAAHVAKETGTRIAVTGSDSSYRPYARQVYFWNLYLSGQGNLAARPGTSNHGLGHAVDVPSYVRALIDKYGAAFGFSKSWSDAPSEWWHILYQSGHYSGPDPNPDYEAGPTFQALKRGDRGTRVAALIDKLRFIHRPASAGDKPYLGDAEKGKNEFDANVYEAVRTFQADHRLQADGIVGQKTWDQLKHAEEREKKNRQINALKSDLADVEASLVKQRAAKPRDDARINDLQDKAKALRQQIRDLGGNPATA